MDKVCTNNGDLILLGDFNVETEENMPDFMSKQLEKHETYFKNAENSSCVDVDLALMNHPQNFQKSIVFETGLSKFHN